MKVPLIPHSSKLQLPLVLLILAILTGIGRNFTGCHLHFPLNKGVERLLSCFSAIFVSSFENVLFLAISNFFFNLAACFLDVQVLEFLLYVL